MLVEGQIHGGAVQGLGQAVMEDALYDAEGQLRTGSFMDYAMPRAADTPAFEILHHPVPTKTNAVGAKGCGEAGCSGSLPVVVSAVLDALSDLGITGDRHAGNAPSSVDGDPGRETGVRRSRALGELAARPGDNRSRGEPGPIH